MLQALHERCAPYTRTPRCAAVFEPAWVLRIGRSGKGHLDIAHRAPGQTSALLPFANAITRGMSGTTPEGTALSETTLDEYMLPLTDGEEAALLAQAKDLESAPLPEYRIARTAQPQRISLKAWYACDYGPSDGIQFYWSSFPTIDNFAFDPMSEPQPIFMECDSPSTPYKTERTITFPSASPTHQRIRADFRAPLHSADWRFFDELPNDGHYIIDLDEIGVVVSNYYTPGTNPNASYSCGDDESVTDDGYQSIIGDSDVFSCAPHDSDYRPQDWRVSLSELNRLIQLKSYYFDYHEDQSYHLCVDASTEDGFCPGAP